MSAVTKNIETESAINGSVVICLVISYLPANLNVSSPQMSLKLNCYNFVQKPI